jgi:protein TonB
MFSLSPSYTNYQIHTSLRSRMAAFLMSLAVFALFVAVLLTMAAMNGGDNGAGSKLVAVNIEPQSQAKSPEKQAAKKQQVNPPQTVRSVQPPVPHPVPTPLPPLVLIHLSRAEMTSADISRMPSRATAAAAAPSQSSGGGAGAGAGDGAGDGPDGAHLYRADWYRKPTDAELAPYLTRGAPPGSWAEIACRTIDNFHVEDCRELGESPPGSGLSRALRLAGWQFLVRPPRINNKPQIGTWVRIHFSFNRAPAGGDDGQGAKANN